MVRHYLDGKGRSRITGAVDLKKSQAYPREHLSFDVVFSHFISVELVLNLP